MNIFSMVFLNVILMVFPLIIYLNNSPDTNPTDMAPIVTSGIGAIPVITQEIKSAVKVTAKYASPSAKAKIEAAGGEVVLG